jgi:hypothetical protein
MLISKYSKMGFMEFICCYNENENAGLVECPCPYGPSSDIFATHANIM